MKYLLLFFSLALVGIDSFGQTNVGGDVYGVWTVENSPYSIRGVARVPLGGILVIEPGVIVEVLGEFSIEGTLLARGTATDSIYFFRSSPPPNPLGGKIVFFNPGSVLDYISVNGLGFTDGAAIFLLTNGTLTNSTIKNSGGIGVYLSDRSGNPVIQNNKFFNNPTTDLWVFPNNCGNIRHNFNTKITVNKGEIASDASWASPGEGTYYYLEDEVEVYEGKTLTIEPGVTVKFTRAASALDVKGRLLAQGTATDSIRFQGTGNNVSPQTGRVRLEGAGSLIDFVSIDNLGYIDYYGALYVGTGCTLTNSTIKNSAVLAVSSSSGYAKIENNRFANNTTDILASPGGFGDIRRNVNAKIYITQGSIESDATWPAPGAGSYYFLDGGVVVKPGQTLTVEPGAIVEFPKTADVLYVDGRLLAKGTATDSIYFRGKGDVDSSPSGRIIIRSSGSVMEYISVDSLGSKAFNPAISLSGSCTIKNSTIKNSPYFGIFVRDPGRHLFNNCSIYANAEYGVNVDYYSSATVDARNCYWGTPTGPFHPSLNPSGTGNAVSDKILFNPWITALSCLPATVKAGNWNDPTIWLCGQVPGSTDPVVLRHVITVPGSYIAHAQRVTYEPGGGLSMGDNGKLQLGN